MDILNGKCPYELLGIEPTATPSEIKKAYRKGALVWHPDKNPDKPEAEDKFQELVRAYDLLSDEKAKAAYDKVLKLKHAAKARDLAMTAEQRKAKEALERRENIAKRQKTDSVAAARKLEAEIIRLREQGKQRIEEEQNRLREEFLAAEFKEDSTETTVSFELKVKWSTKKSSEENGGYSMDELKRLFQKYGPVDIVMSKKGGSAIVAFEAQDDAMLAQAVENGLKSNPFKECVWVSRSSGRADFVTAAVELSTMVEDFAMVEKITLENLERANNQMEL